MSDNIELRIKKMGEALDALEKDATAVGTLAVDKREKESERIDEAIKKLERDYKMIEMEVRLLPQEQKVLFKNELKNLTKRMKDVQSELKWAKTGDAAAAEQKSGGAATEEGLIQHGDNLMTSINASTANTIVMINEAEMIGVNTAAQLKAQGETLQKVSDELYEIEDTLARATAITRRMARRVLTDRYVWGLTILIILAIIGVIALRVVKNTQISNNAGNA